MVRAADDGYRFANYRTLAEWVGVHEHTVKTWKAAGCPALQRKRKGGYDGVAVLRWRLADTLRRDDTVSKAAAAASGEDGEAPLFDDPRDRKAHFEAERAKLAVQRDRGLMISKVAAYEIWSRLVGAFTAHLERQERQLPVVLDRHARTDWVPAIKAFNDDERARWADEWEKGETPTPHKRRKGMRAT